MENVVIYYQKQNNEKIECSIQFINDFIDGFHIPYNIKAVYIEDEDQQEQFLELVQAPLSEIDSLYINEEIDDDFNLQLLTQLSRTEKFNIKYFNKVKK